jgi:hypothetical protein
LLKINELTTDFAKKRAEFKKGEIPRGNQLILNRLTPFCPIIGFIRVQFERGCVEIALPLLVLLPFGVVKGSATPYSGYYSLHASALSGSSFNSARASRQLE